MREFTQAKLAVPLAHIEQKLFYCQRVGEEHYLKWKRKTQTPPKSNQKPHDQGIPDYTGSRLQHDHRLTARPPGTRQDGVSGRSPRPSSGSPGTPPAAHRAGRERGPSPPLRSAGRARPKPGRRGPGEGNTGTLPRLPTPPPRPRPPRRTHLLLALPSRSPPPPPPPPGAERVGGGEGGVRPPGPERGAARAGGGGARGAARAPADPPLPPRAPGQPSGERRRRHRLRAPFPAALAPPAPPPMMTTMTAVVTSQLGGRRREGRKRRCRHLGEGGAGAGFCPRGGAMGRWGGNAVRSG